MYEKTSYFADKKWFIPLAGFLAGGINGLLGAGGGIIVVFALTYALKGKEADAREVFANALCVMLPVSAVSCIIYAVKGNIITEGFGIYVIPAIIGGAAGAILLDNKDKSAEDFRASDNLFRNHDGNKIERFAGKEKK